MQLGAATLPSISKSAQGAKHFSGYVEIRVDSSDERTKTPCVTWAVEQLRSSFKNKEVPTQGSGAPAAIIVIAPFESALTKEFNSPAERKPEMIALIPSKSNDKSILISGVDARGITYSLLELTGRVRSADDPIAALKLHAPIVEITPNRIRSVARAFCSEIEDKSWFYDRDSGATTLIHSPMHVSIDSTLRSESAMTFQRVLLATICTLPILI